MLINQRTPCLFCGVFSVVEFNPFIPTVAFNICCPRDCVSRTANVGTVGKNGLKRLTLLVKEKPDVWIRILMLLCITKLYRTLILCYVMYLYGRNFPLKALALNYDSLPVSRSPKPSCRLEVLGSSSECSVVATANIFRLKLLKVIPYRTCYIKIRHCKNYPLEVF